MYLRAEYAHLADADWLIYSASDISATPLQGSNQNSLEMKENIPSDFTEF